ncbi:hypothetical protein [Alteribacillus sp. YIM 98480]|uniref:hypothetical protein n=1 Tax=Alteribacillus sp. YIM 98480 TaxID=2606599 RepID=UPI00131E8DF5|nr:hypothetical protein [Alteribacillus sp. YIM 98480]
MSSPSAYSLEIPSVRQWKAKISFPYAAPPGLVAREQGACAFLIKFPAKCLKRDLIHIQRLSRLHLQ